MDDFNENDPASFSMLVLCEDLMLKIGSGQAIDTCVQYLLSLQAYKSRINISYNPFMGN